MQYHDVVELIGGTFDEVDGRLPAWINRSELGRRVLEAALFDVSKANLPDEEADALFTLGNDLLLNGAFTLPYETTAFISSGPPGGCVWVVWLKSSQGEGLPPVLNIAIFANLLFYGLVRLLPSEQGIRWNFRGSGGVDESEIPAIAEAIGGYSVAILVALSVNAVNKEIVSAPERLNKAREQRGRPPIRDKIILTIPIARRGGQDSGTHASPFPHWRRGHLRTINAGTDRERKVKVSACLVNVGNGDIPKPKKYEVRSSSDH